MPADFAKALCLGADGVATQKPELRAKLDVDHGAERLARFLQASTELMKVLARACGHDHLNQFEKEDITSWKRDVADLAGISYAGFDPNR